jgi:hypothetical protein
VLGQLKTRKLYACIAIDVAVALSSHGHLKVPEAKKPGAMSSTRWRLRWAWISTVPSLATIERQLAAAGLWSDRRILGQPSLIVRWRDVRRRRTLTADLLCVIGGACASAETD